MVKILTAALSNGRVMIQIMQDDKALAYVELEPEAADKIAGELQGLANMVRAAGIHPKLNS